MKFANIKLRAATAMVLVIVILLAVLGGPLPLLVLALTVNFLAVLEYNKLVRLLGYIPQASTIQVAGLLLITLAWSVASGYISAHTLALFIPVPAIICSAELQRNTPYSFQNIAFTLLGLLWISLPLAAFSTMGLIMLPTYHAAFYIGYFLLLWAGDTGAYFAGSLLGRHPLLSRVSPKKTIEGSAGGLLAAIIVAFANTVFLPILSLRQWLFIALIVNLTGTLGDLVKSMLKRSAGVKDSGNLLPGHGGIIDRFDSLLGSAPFVFLYLALYA